MRQSPNVYMSLGMEHLLSHLFGKARYHGYVDIATTSSWRRNLLKIAKYVRKSIQLNVGDDQFGREDLLRACDRLTAAVHDAKTFDAINIAAIEHLLTLVFMLLGRMPNHWRYKSPYRNDFWRLNDFRDLHYTQSLEQKVRLLLHAVDERELVHVELGDRDSLREILFRDFAGDSQAFLEWFKRDHPHAYCQVF